MKFADIRTEMEAKRKILENSLKEVEFQISKLEEDQRELESNISATNEILENIDRLLNSTFCE